MMFFMYGEGKNEGRRGSFTGVGWEVEALEENRGEKCSNAQQFANE